MSKMKINVKNRGGFIVFLCSLVYFVSYFARKDFAAVMAAMLSEMKSSKWFWGAIGLQLAIGYTVGYLVYTVGTLISSPASLNIGAAIAGGCAILVIAALITFVAVKQNRRADAAPLSVG